MKNISYSVEDIKDLTSSGWLIAMIKFAEDIDFFAPFMDINVNIKQVKYSTVNKFQTLVASVLTGCKYTNDINETLVPDTLAASLFGMNRFPDQSQINEFLRRFSDSNIESLRSISSRLFLENSPSLHMPDDIVVDFDMSGLVANGRKFEHAEKGYFPRRRGETGYQMSAAYIGRTGEVIDAYLDPGNTHCNDRFDDLLSTTTNLLSDAQLQCKLIIRGDSHYGSAENIEKLLNAKVRFVVKGYSSSQSRNLALQVPRDNWIEIDRFVEMAEIKPQESSELRIIVCSIVSPKTGEIHYSHLITNIEGMTPVELFHFYNKRQTIEAFIKICKNVYGLKNLRTGSFYGIYAFLWVTLMTHNMIIWAKKTIFSKGKLSKAGIPTLIRKLSKLPAKVLWENGTMKVIMSSASLLAQQLVNALNPQPIQLQLPFMANYT